MQDLLASEDTDGNCLITIDDRGPKVGAIVAIDVNLQVNET